MAKAKLPPISHRRRSVSDPFTAVLTPPSNETEEERSRRITRADEAQRISDSIDEQIRQEKILKKKARPEVKVLLLGQSESGKSTTLKQFQLLHTPSAFHAERIAWRTVIYLNLVRSLRRILEGIAPESDRPEEFEDPEEHMGTPASVVISSNGRPPSALSTTEVPNYERYKRQLEPLLVLEERLIRLLSTPDEEEATHLPSQPSWDAFHQRTVPHVPSGRSSGRPTISIPSPSHAAFSASPLAGPSSASFPRSTSEVSIHTNSNWKRVLALGATRSKSPKSAHSGEIEGWWEDPSDPCHELNRCAPAMHELWKDKAVQRKLAEKRIRLQESSGFYLDDISRVTAKKYIPTDGDVLKARLKTTGVVEHNFTIPSGSGKGMDWTIYDVGGSRNQRQAWAPYFQDVDAIIYLAPISGFDQVLDEDSRVNRLEDALLLWKSLVSNKLLAEVSIVLFLNKCDLLQSKLNAGVKLNQHMVSYGDRPNDYESVSKYFRNKFGALHQSFTPNKEREMYIHLTCVTDTRRTSTIIANVRDIIIKANLKSLKLV